MFVATRSASRVFPTPPMPTSVRSGRRQQALGFRDFVPAAHEAGQVQGEVSLRSILRVRRKLFVRCRFWFRCVECTAPLDLAQGVTHGQGGGVPVLGSSGHCPLDDGRHVVGDAVLTQIRCGFGCDAYELGHQLFAAASFECGMAGERAEQGGPESIDVGCRARGGAAEHLGGGERWRTRDDAGSSLEPARHVRDAEIRQRRFAIVGEEDIGWFDVTVDDALIMRRLQRARQLHSELQHVVQR